jgi:hypothetical protein
MISSKNTSVEEFNFDKLSAPPLSMFLSPMEINELRTIATSLRYAGNAEKRYKAIDNVCRSRGLVKFAAGTNRVVYRHPEFPDILFKIATDNVGMRDNPAEFRNQYELKPFVAKTFEVSPCGTVAVVERVNNIRSREEYMAMAGDISKLLLELFSDYLMADIGTEFFCNYGWRLSTGIVLLDYPYLYELDENKLYCTKPDNTTPSGKCDGRIVYDYGFNKLVCTKCGAEYKAVELRNEKKDTELIVEREGDIEMEITIKGGSKKVNKTIKTGSINNSNFRNVKSSIPTTTNVGEKALAATATKTVDLTKTTETPSGLQITRRVKKKRVEPVKTVEVEEVAPVINRETTRTRTVEVENKPVKEYHIEEKYVNGVSTIKLDPETEEHIDNFVAAPVEELVVESDDEEVVEKVETKRVGHITDEEEEDSEEEDNDEQLKDFIGSISITAPDKETVESPITISEDIRREAIANEKDLGSPVVVFTDNIDRAVGSLDNIPIDKVKYYTLLDGLTKLLKKLPATNESINFLVTAINNITSEEKDGEFTESLSDLFKIDSVMNSFIAAHKESASIVANNIYKDGDNLVIDYAMQFVEGEDESEKIYTIDSSEDLEIEDVFKGTVSEEDIKNEGYKGIQFFEAKTIDVKELDPSENHLQILVFVDNNDDYVTVNGNIVASATINDKTIGKSAIVSKSWITEVEELIKNETEVSEVEEVQTGVFPPTVEIVDTEGITAEEFLAQIDSEEE